MPYGMESARTIFQRAIEQVHGEDTENMFCYLDDIQAENEWKKKTDIVLNKLRNVGKTINEKNHQAKPW